MPLFYRNATVEDLPLIVDIYNSTIESRMVTADTTLISIKSKLTWFHEHTPDRRPIWMVEDEQNEAAGWVSFQDFYGRQAYDGTAEISIYLHRNARGKGLGKLILAHVISRCTSMNIHTLLGFIFAHNTASIKLFLNNGFEEWGNLHDIAIMDGNRYSLKVFGKKIVPSIS